MAGDRDIIQALEKQIGTKLNQMPLGSIMEISNGYALDEGGRVIGLNLWRAGISDLSLLAGLTGITHLYLGSNEISDLSPLAGLTALKTLRLNGNQLTGVSPLARLTALTVLFLSGNQLTDISPLARLTYLTELDLVGNRLTDLSPLARLTALKKLSLWDNKLVDLPPLAGLTALSFLDLDKNHLTDVSPLAGLTALTALYLNYNRLTDLSPLAGLENLEMLDVSNNRITRLPENMVRPGRPITWERKNWGNSGLYLAGNPLESPPVEIVKQGDAAVRNYFEEIKAATVPLLHSKLLVVGSGAVGKTTLMKKLKDPAYRVILGQEPSTHGINIVPWELTCTFKNGLCRPVKISFWDFGGQDIMYTTHQFFLTKRSLYLLAWEARQEGQETAGFDYWLNIIKLLGGGSPVIIVMNKADSRTQSIDEASYREKFPNIYAFLKVSCLTGTGMNELTEQVRACFSGLDHLQDRLPRSWMDIRQELGDLGQDFIPLAGYFAVCQKHGLNEERATFLSDYLHDLGVILHFRGDLLLENTVILNPEWATAAVYRIMDNISVAENKGRFNYADLGTLWPGDLFPADKHPQLLRLMEKFELCFPVMGGPIHIVPELLPANKPVLDFLKYTGPACLRLEYHYDFMPRGIISRFISRLYYLIYREHFWKTGVELVLEKTLALVLAEPLNRKLSVFVYGPDKSELLAIIRHHLDDIHRSLNMEKNVHYREMVPCHCRACVDMDKPQLFARQVLDKFTAKGLSHIQCQESGEQVSIDLLLKGLTPPPLKTDLKEVLDTLILTAARLQARARAVRSGEDDRNSIIAEFLTARGYIVKDQTRRGSSPSGKSMGELDMLIETADGSAVSVIEAFNLGTFDSTVIDDHYRKIFGYDANGLENNYLLVYAGAEDFTGLWKKYLDHLPGVEVKYKLLGRPEEKETQYADIKLAGTRHFRADRETTLYHLFVNMHR